MPDLNPILPDSKKALQKALSVLERDEVVIGPTDTVYGLLARMYSQTAVERVRGLKGIAPDRPLIVLVPSCGWAQVLSGQPLSETRLTSLWPGPLTIVAKASQEVPGYVTGEEDTVAIRWPGDSFALRLADALRKPLVAPSANPTGHPTIRTAEEALECFGEAVPLIVRGDDPVESVPSTIVSIAEGPVRILREGAVTRSAIAELCDLE